MKKITKIVITLIFVVSFFCMNGISVFAKEIKRNSGFGDYNDIIEDESEYEDYNGAITMYVDKIYSDDTSIEGYLEDEEGYFVEDASVYADILGKRYESKSNAYGEFSITDIPSLKEVQSIKLYAECEGYSLCKKTVVVKQTEFEVDISEYYYEDKSIKGVIYKGNDGYDEERVYNATVYTKINNKIYSANTSRRGSFEIKNIPTLKIGKRINIFIKKEGYETKKITISVKRKGILKIVCGSIPYGSKTIIGCVQNERKEEISDSNVYVKIKGKTYRTKTNKNGMFKLVNIPVLNIGKRIKIFAEKKGYKSGADFVLVDSLGELKIKVNSLVYGDKNIKGYIKTDSGKRVKGAIVYTKIKGKVYKAKTDKNGKYTLKNIPVVGPDKSIHVYAKKKGYETGSCVSKAYFDNYEDWDVWHYYAFPTDTCQRGYVKNVHRDDTLIITIGSTVYKKKFIRNKSKANYFINTASFPAGTVIRFKLVTKFGKVLVNYKDIIWGYKSFTIGDTKEHVLLTPGYRHPTNKTYTPYGETWWYGNYNHISFDAEGKVDYWYFSE